MGEKDIISGNEPSNRCQVFFNDALYLFLPLNGCKDTMSHMVEVSGTQRQNVSPKTFASGSHTCE